MARSPDHAPAESTALSTTHKPGDPPEGSWASRQVAAMAAAWDRGVRMTAAEILERHPDLDTEAAIRLIYEEVCLRREAGLVVDTDALVRRYPRWSDALQDLLDCDRLLSPSGALAVCPDVGETLGPFRLLAELGRGGSGRAYLAAEPSLADRPVVLKVIPGDQDEHLALARLRHTHIVPLFSEHFFPDRNLRVLCMPYLGGASLAQIVNELADVAPGRRSGKLLVTLLDRNTRTTPTPLRPDGPFRRSLEEASYTQAIAWVVACLADALYYAHAHGVVHMDIKPSNVLITVDGQPMLLDFHLARGPIRPGDWVADRLGGTPGWMSPEQQTAMKAVDQGRPAAVAVDGRTDIFALGLLLREALAVPVSDQDGRGARIRLSGRPDVSAGLGDIILKCLARNPTDRYQEATDLADDLRRHVTDLPLRGVGNRSPIERWRKWRRRRPGALAWAVTGLTIVLAAAIATGVFADGYRQRLAALRNALEDGRRFRTSGQYDDAIHTLQRALNDADTVPPVRGLTRALGDELLRAKRGQMAEELHDLADSIRFRHGIDLPPGEGARELVRHCRAIWEQRDRLIPADAAIETGAAHRIKTDLLELAIVWADLELRSTSPAVAAARSEAMRVLDLADAAFGPSLAVDLLRKQLGATRGKLAAPAAMSGGSRSAWEHYDMGRYYVRRSQFALAAAEFHHALDARPQDFWSNFYHGLCSFRLGRYNDAVAAFRVCTALLPPDESRAAQSAICRYNAAMAYDALGQSDRAFDEYSRAIELDHNLAAARLNRGNISYKRGQIPNAIDDFEHALKVQPADRETVGRLRYDLALAQLSGGDHAQALENAEEAVRIGYVEAKPLLDGLRGTPRSLRAPVRRIVGSSDATSIDRD